MALKRVRLELGRTPEFPEGSQNHGYEFVIPLTSEGHIDLDAWRAKPAICTVLRFWGKDPDERGQIVRTAAEDWAFSYEPGEADDEPLFRFADHVFKPGEYVAITEQDGTTLPFRVVSLEDWHPAH